MDSSSFTIAIVGYVIVFTALVVLYFVFSNIPRLLNLHIRIKLKKDCKEGEDCIDKYPEFITGQENAAIATAIYLYFTQLHDEESAKMTIKKVKKDYSPWSSRVHTIHSFQR